MAGRLIDADALIAMYGDWYTEEGTEDGYIGELHYLLDTAPTIDAIPVEWMRDKMRGYASALKSTETAALVRVMQMWEEEQEASE